MLSYQGKPILPDDSFTLVMNNYRATGAGGFDCYLSSPRIQEIQTEVSELLLDYLGSHTLIDIPEQPAYHVILPNRKP